jgi:tetratricopeptide (TPR) repeat protein
MRTITTLLLVGLFGSASVAQDWPVSGPFDRRRESIADREASNPFRSELQRAIQPGMDIIVGVAKTNIDVDGKSITTTVAGEVYPAKRVENDWIWIDFGWIHRNDVLPLAKAAEYFTSKIERQPTALAYLVRGAALSQEGKSDKAFADFDVALKLEPRNAVAYLCRGRARAIKLEIEQAIADYTRALALDGTLGDALITRGSLYCDQQLFQEGIRDFTTLIKLTPRDARAYILRATAWGELNDADNEFADANTAITLLPSSDMAFSLRADAYGLKGDKDRAIADYSEALRLNPRDVDNLIARALIWEKKGALEKAIADVTRAIEISPYSAMAYTNRGWIRVSQEKYAEALADFERTTELSPNSAGAWGNKAWLLATCAQDNFRNGGKALEAATKACDLTKWNDSSSLETYAAAKAELGDFAEAVKRQTQALQLSPPDLKPKAEARLKLYQAGRPCRGEEAKP